MGRIGIGEEKGKFEVVSVEALGLGGDKTEIFNSADNLLRPSKNRLYYSLFSKDEFTGDEITLSFETPARIKAKYRLSADIPFSLLIKRLSERVFLLAHFHCGAEMGDFEGFAEDSGSVETVRNKLRWIDWKRFSTRQQTTMKFGGLIGEITYRGDFQKYLPLLRLGEYIHVGKAATFGLGKYRIKHERRAL